MEPAEGKSVGYGELIRGNASFRALWMAQIVSLLGDWFNFVATAALVARLSESGLAIGFLVVVRMLAPFFVSPIAGVFADRYDRRRVLIVSDLVRAVVVLGFLWIREPSQVWALYALTAAQLGISGFFYTARSAILPSIVSARELGPANALGAATWSVMLALGAATGGLISGTLGVYPAFVLDSLTFVISALFVLRVVVQPSRKIGEAAEVGRTGLQLYREGLSYLWAQRPVLLIALHKAANALVVASGFTVIQVSIAQDVFPLGEAGGLSLGLLFASSGIGTGLGPILARRLTGDSYRPLCVAILVGYLLNALGLFMTAPLFGFGLVLVATFVRGAGGGIVWVMSTQLLMQEVPGTYLGRVFGTEFALFSLAGAVAATWTGWLLDSTLGISGTTYLLGIMTLVPALLWALWLRRTRLDVAASPATKD